MQGKWPLDKCGPILVPNKIGVLLVWLLTSCSCLSAYHQTSITRWPLDLRQLTLRFSFQASCRCGCERCLMNCLARNSLWLPTRTPPPQSPSFSPPSIFCNNFIYSHISAAFCWAGAFPEKAPRRCEQLICTDVSLVGLACLGSSEKLGAADWQ